MKNSGIDLECRNFIVRGKHLVPADIHAEAFVDGCKQGKEILVRLWKPRNARQHNLFFAMLHRVVKNSDFWQSEEALRKEVCKRCNHVERKKQPDGTWRVEASSISCASMGEAEFNRFFNRAKYILMGISGMTEEELTTPDREV